MEREEARRWTLRRNEEDTQDDLSRLRVRTRIGINPYITKIIVQKEKN